MMNNLYYNPKRLKKIRNKRTGRTKKIWGWVLTGLGGITVLSTLADMLTSGLAAGDLVSGLIFLIPGLYLLLSARKQVGKWDRYQALIDPRGNTSIPMLAQRMELPMQQVYTDLQTMINNDFFIGPNFNIEARIDPDRELLVMCSGGRPLEPIPEPQQARQEEPEEGNWQDPEDIPEAEWKEESPIRVKLTDLEMIQEAIRNAKDEDVRNSLYGLEGSFRRIDEKVQEDPELKKTGSVRKLYRYYMPQLLELIEAYESEDTPADIRAQIRDSLRNGAQALASIEAELIEKDQMDMELDIEVLNRMFASDGLLKEDPFMTGQSAAPRREEKAGQAWTQSETSTEPQPQPKPQAR